MPRAAGILTLLLTAAAMWPAAGSAQPPPQAEPYAALRGAAALPPEVKGAKAVVLFFLSTDCPVANYYTAEVSAIGKDYAAEALRLFGKRGLVDLVSLMTSYSATAALLNAFDMQLPEGQESLLPLP